MIGSPPFDPEDKYLTQVLARELLHYDKSLFKDGSPANVRRALAKYQHARNLAITEPDPFIVRLVQGTAKNPFFALLSEFLFFCVWKDGRPDWPGWQAYLQRIGAPLTLCTEQQFNGLTRNLPEAGFAFLRSKKQ